MFIPLSSPWTVCPQTGQMLSEYLLEQAWAIFASEPRQGWWKQTPVPCFCICPPAQVVILPTTPSTSTGGWAAIWARKRRCICGMQLTIIYLEINYLAWYTLGKKNLLKEFTLMQKWTFCSNHLGYSFVPWMFSMLAQRLQWNSGTACCKLLHFTWPWKYYVGEKRWNALRAQKGWLKMSHVLSKMAVVQRGWTQREQEEVWTARWTQAGTGCSIPVHPSLYNLFLLFLYSHTLTSSFPAPQIFCVCPFLKILTACWVLLLLLWQLCKTNKH